MQKWLCMLVLSVFLLVFPEWLMAQDASIGGGVATDPSAQGVSSVRKTLPSLPKIKVSENSEETVWIDPIHVAFEAQGERVEFSVCLDHHRKKVAGTNTFQAAHRLITPRFSYPDKKVKQYGYFDTDEQGEFAGEKDTPEPNWEAIHPGSFEEKVYELLVALGKQHGLIP